MGLESVVEGILATGKSEAQEVVESARREKEEMMRSLRDEGAKLLAEREASARGDAERKRVQGLARAELESKREVLIAQKAVLDRVREAALARLGEGSDPTLVRRLLDANESEWRDGTVVCNRRDEPVVRSIVGSNFGGAIECVGGVVIESRDGTRKVDLRFETLLKDVWDDSVRGVAEVLWPRT